jgi:putative tributyrin esterase
MSSGSKSRRAVGSHRPYANRRAFGIGALLTLIAILSPIALAQTPARAAAVITKRAEVPTGRIQDRTFQSESLSREMRYRILLPQGYSASSRSYPVLYLLHGWHGDFQNWTTLTNLTHYAEKLPIIIVMPDAGDSWYVNSASMPQDKFEQYVLRDVINDVDQHWHTLRSPHRRAIAGLSMGGYGAVKFALKNPGSFGFAGSISGAFNATKPELAESRADLAPSLVGAFGPPNSTVRAENDVFQLAGNSGTQAIPYLYIDCGNRDVSFLQANRDLAATLSERKITYEYHETPGAHTWQYWDERLPDLLKAVVRNIAHEKTN